MNPKGNAIQRGGITTQKSIKWWFPSLFAPCLFEDLYKHHFESKLTRAVSSKKNNSKGFIGHISGVDGQKFYSPKKGK